MRSPAALCPRSLVSAVGLAPLAPRSKMFCISFWVTTNCKIVLLCRYADPCGVCPAPATLVFVPRFPISPAPAVRRSSLPIRMPLAPAAASESHAVRVFASQPSLRGIGGAFHGCNIQHAWTACGPRGRKQMGRPGQPPRKTYSVHWARLRSSFSLPERFRMSSASRRQLVAHARHK